MVDTLEVLSGVVFGAGIIVLIMNVLVVEFPFWIVIPILLVLFVVAMGFALNRKGAKPVWAVIGAFIFGILGFNYAYDQTCGANNSDVKVMKPMAQKISDYIVKNGIPESLKDIPNLPYGLEGCEKSSEYKRVENGAWKQADMKNAQLIKKIENCSILIKNKKISLFFSVKIYPSDNEEYISLKMENNSSKTVSHIDFKKDGKYFVVDYPLKFGSGKRDGICNPMKQ